MAGQGPFERWRLTPDMSPESVRKALFELQRILNTMQGVLEQGTVQDSGAPSDAEYVLGVADGDLPNGRVLANGQNTTVDYGTPGEVSIDVPNAPTTLPPSGPAGGDLAGTYPNPTVARIRGQSVEAGSPSDGDTWQFGFGQWNHVPIGGDLDGTPSASEVIRIRGNPVELGTPTAGDVYRYDGSQFRRWSPKYMTATLAGDQTANLAVGNHVEFDTVAETSGHITLSTGIGQANGLFTLPAGVWWVTVSLSAAFSGAGGTLGVRSRNNTAGVFFGGSEAFARPYSRTQNDAAPILTHGIMTNSSTATMEARITVSSLVTQVDRATSISIIALA